MEGGAVTAPGETTERRRLFSCPKRRVQSSGVSPLPRVVFRGAAGGDSRVVGFGPVRQPASLMTGGCCA